MYLDSFYKSRISIQKYLSQFKTQKQMSVVVVVIVQKLLPFTAVHGHCL